MTPGFLAAILDGFEQTLDHVLVRMEEGDLKREVNALQAHIACTRQELVAVDDPAGNSIPGETHVSRIDAHS